MDGLISVFVTTADRAEAEKIALILITENLAACVNIFPGVRSIYRWQGEVQQSNECALLAKAHSEKFDDLQKRIKDFHSYECPCIVAWPIVDGAEAFIKWLEEN